MTAVAFYKHKGRNVFTFLHLKFYQNKYRKNAP